MNKFDFSWTRGDESPQAVECAALLSPAVQEMLIPVLEQAFELPMLQADRRIDVSGDMHLTFRLDQYSASHLRQALLTAILEDNGTLTQN